MNLNPCPFCGSQAALGDWTPGRYAWEFSDMKPLGEPIPAKGKQGLWEWKGGDSL